MVIVKHKWRLRAGVMSAMGWEPPATEQGIITEWRDMLATLYKDMSLQLIECLTGFSWQTIRGDMKLLNIPRRSQGGRNNKLHRLSNGMSLYDVLAITHASYSTAYLRLIKHKMPVAEFIDKWGK